MKLNRRSFFLQMATPLVAGTISSISQEPRKYHGWPTVTRRANGELLLVVSGGRERHVCPYGQVLLMRSHDEGATWTYPEVLMDTAIDDRDAGICETAKGSLLVTTFTSLAYEKELDKHPEWNALHNRVDAAARKKLLDCWMLRSTDGLTWSQPYKVPVNSPHGPTALKNGSLLYVGKKLWGDETAGACLSKDDGVTWKWISAIPTRPGDDFKQYHELHAVEAADGRIIAQIRNHNEANKGETLQCESRDGGKTWSVPHPIGVWGLPSHLLRLRDGRLVMSYGYRRKPFGNLARISKDNGATWSEPVTLSADGVRGDLGYPSTVELSNGKLLTVWYEQMEGNPLAVLRQTVWSPA